MKKQKFSTLLKAAILASTAQIVMPALAHDFAPPSKPVRLATGQFITPTFLRGSVQQILNPGLSAYPNFMASEAVKSQLSPDGTTLAVLTAGFNSVDNAAGKTDAAASTQFIFFYDVTGANKTKPALKQVIPQVNAHIGLVFSPDGKTLYAAGGADDVVYAYTLTAGAWAPASTAKIVLGHKNVGVGLGVRPNASGLAVSADGTALVAVNNYNDSISIIDTATSTIRYEHDLRPYFANNEGVAGGVGGTFPLGIVMKGNTVYVASDRDREVVVVDVSSLTAGHLVKRIKLDGNGLGLTLDKAQAKLYVSQDNADQVAVIDTSTNAIIAKIDARAPAGLLTQPREGFGFGEFGKPAPHYTGAGTFATTISPDGKTLYAVNAGSNSVAVIPLTGPFAHKVVGLIPTAYEPHDVTFSPDGSFFYIVNGKSVTGPNPDHLYGNTASLATITLPGGNAAAAAASSASNEYQFQLEKSSLVSAPVPNWEELPILTEKVAQNNFYIAKGGEEDDEVMDFLRHRIKHVIYIIKENRTFDQILGDLGNGSNGNPNLTMFGAAITPNFHALAKNFVTLDNFTDAGDGSMDGWSWALQGRVTNMETITQQINYAFVNRGLSYESEGGNRGVPVNWGTVAQRDAAAGKAGTTNYTTASAGATGGTANLLTGTGDHAASDAPFGVQGGYIFDAVLAAGGTVRDYGPLVTNIGSIGTKAAPIMDPFSAGEIQVAPLKPALAPYTDLYFRGYDNNYPDLWRYNEWKREFDLFVKNGGLPNLSLVRLHHDHTGNFGTAFAGVNTPEAQQADNDFAVGKLVDAVAHSPYAQNTLVIVTEDDAQDGPDHVDSHRTTTYMAGPFVKQGGVVSTHYSQINVIRTIEDILGTEHINLNTAFQRPMADAFNIRSTGAWTFNATASTILLSTTLKLAQGKESVRFAEGPIVKPKHTAAYWERVTKGFDFSDADRVPTAKFNRVLWKGIMGNKPYPKLAFDQYHQADKDD
jgi:YVTN family beta-propeller protein